MPRYSPQPALDSSRVCTRARHSIGFPHHRSCWVATSEKRYQAMVPLKPQRMLDTTVCLLPISQVLPQPPLSASHNSCSCCPDPPVSRTILRRLLGVSLRHSASSCRPHSDAPPSSPQPSNQEPPQQPARAPRGSTRGPLSRRTWRGPGRGPGRGPPTRRPPRGPLSRRLGGSPERPRPVSRAFLSRPCARCGARRFRARSSRRARAGRCWSWARRARCGGCPIGATRPPSPHPSQWSLPPTLTIDQIDPSHFFKAKVCNRLQGRLLPARRICLATEVNSTPENHRFLFCFFLDARAGGLPRPEPANPKPSTRNPERLALNRAGVCPAEPRPRPLNAKSEKPEPQAPRRSEEHTSELQSR